MQIAVAFLFEYRWNSGNVGGVGVVVGIVDGAAAEAAPVVLVVPVVAVPNRPRLRNHLQNHLQSSATILSSPFHQEYGGGAEHETSYLIQPF